MRHPVKTADPLTSVVHTAYWIEKLRPFEHGPRFLAGVLPSDDDGRAVACATCAAPRGAASIDALGLAAFIVVVSRYNGGEPLIVGSPADSDTGAFTFVATGAWDERRAVHEFLNQLHEEMAAARRHQPYPLTDVASALGFDPIEHERSLLQLAYACGPEAAGASMAERAGVCLHVEPAGAELHLRLSATGEAYPAVLLPQLVAHVARAIEWLGASADAPLERFDLLSPAERTQMATAFAGERVTLPKGLTLHGLIAAQAARTPDATAVVYGDAELTYAALDGQANHLASVLHRTFGVTPGARVGVMMERSEKIVVALTAVMKAGAAYVPINPRHPWEMVRYMIENAGISVLIVDSESIAAATSFAGALIVVDLELRGEQQAEPPDVDVADTGLAYVIYTSGSTGRPKGVAVEHRAIVNTILWRNAFYGLGPSDINLQIPSFAFDSSVVDIFCVLTVGGTLVIPDEEMRLDARRLLELSRARRVTSCIVTPSYYQLLVGELAGTVPSLRAVTLAGESATPALVAAHLDTMPEVAIYNEYGPTENAVCSTACRLETKEPTVSIGRPIWNVSVVILDAAGRLVPIGVAGEIHLGGAGLARGYLNQDALTAERFIQSPVPDVCPGLLYRTGDRACWRPDGSLEFLGRVDNQVKVRGFRIELGEVEQALRGCPDVTNAAVICKTDAGGAKYLAAYVESTADITRPQLREHLGRHVPYYMIPDAFTVLPRLPLNLNGKIDRTALAGLDDFSTRPSQDTAPLSPLETLLAGLWGDVLKRAPIGVDDNFFAIGGNSLRVMELTSRIRGELGADIELLDIYTYPTIRELADRLASVT
jgi:bacitracin synthase 3